MQIITLGIVMFLFLLGGCSTDEAAPGSTPSSNHRHDSSADGGTTSETKPAATLWGAPELTDENPDPDVVEVHLTAAKGRATLDGKEIDVLAYNGSVPGPILRAKQHQTVIVHFTNQLAEPTTVHWHGLRISEAMDGSPVIQTPVPPGGTFTYSFMVPDAGSFWYHPHVNTYAQLARGLYGAIVVEGAPDPAYDLERSLILDDVLFDADGNISPPTLDGLVPLTGRVGKVLLTNGKAAARAKASATKGKVERWRIVNSANARTMRLLLEGAKGRLIGADGGLFTAPVPLPERLVLPVGGRVEIEVSYDTAGTARLVNAVPTSSVEEKTTMLEVAVADGPAPRTIAWPTITPAVAERPAVDDFDISFDYQQGSSITWTVNGESNPKEPLFTVAKGATVKITLSNASAVMDHPFHLHGQFFRVNDPAWPGLRDTVLVPAAKPIEIIAYLDNPGMWMAHCHILEHAEVGMMAHIMVLGDGDTMGH